MKLLIVEDSKLVGERLHAYFAAALPALEIAVAEGAVTALARFREQQPDIVILDIQLPDGNGVEVLKSIRRERPPTRMLMFSNHVFCRRQCAAAGADGFFDKASDFEALAMAVKTLANAATHDTEKPSCPTGPR